MIQSLGVGWLVVSMSVACSVGAQGAKPPLISATYMSQRSRLA